MAKRRQTKYQTEGWVEDRETTIIQHMRADETEDLERRIEYIRRRYSCVWNRVEDGKVLVQAEIAQDANHDRDDIYAIGIQGIGDLSWMVGGCVSNTLDSAKSIAEHRVQKWMEQYPEVLEVPAPEEE